MSAYEQGTITPSSQTWLKMANGAAYPYNVYCWQRAGLSPHQIGSLLQGLREKHEAANKPSSDPKYQAAMELLRREQPAPEPVDISAINEPVPNAEEKKVLDILRVKRVPKGGFLGVGGSVPMLAETVPHPMSTFCYVLENMEVVTDAHGASGSKADFCGQLILAEFDADENLEKNGGWFDGLQVGSLYCGTDTWLGKVIQTADFLPVAADKSQHKPVTVGMFQEKKGKLYFPPSFKIVGRVIALFPRLAEPEVKG
jgi:hypothetical protein